MNIQNSFWSLILVFGLIVGCMVIVPFVGSLILIGDRLASIHVGLDWTLYAALSLVVYLLAIRPVMLVIFAPTISITGLAKLSYKKKLKLAQKLVGNSKLSSETSTLLKRAVVSKALLDEPLLNFIAELDEAAMQKIETKASLAFVSNTIVQNGRLEAVALLSVNIRLVHELVDHYGFRPSLPSLMRIYGEVFIMAFLIDEVGDLDLDSALSMCLSPAIAAIPGFHLITHSLIQGATSSLFTLRVGIITRDILKEGLGSLEARRQRRGRANREAAARAVVVFPQSIGELKTALFQRLSPLSPFAQTANQTSPSL